MIFETHPRRRMLLILPPIAVGSAFLNNTPLVAMMIPVIRDLCRTTGLSKARLYIPLSFASILGGTCTLIGTATNLIIAGLVVDAMASGAGGSARLREGPGRELNGRRQRAVHEQLIDRDDLCCCAGTPGG